MTSLGLRRKRSDISVGPEAAGEGRCILIVAEYIRRLPSSATRWVPEVARALAARGHRVTVALGGADDHEEILPLCTLIHNTRRTHTGDDPGAFVRWVELTRRRLAPDACISFTRLYAGDLCIPLGMSSAAYLRTLFRTKSPHSAVFELGHRLWLFPSAWRESKASLPPARGSEMHRQPAPNAHGYRLATFGPAVPGCIDLGYASRFKAANVAERRELRSRARDLLGLSQSRLVLLASATHFHRSELGPVLTGLARVRSAAAHRAPILLLTGRRSHSLHKLAVKADVLDGVRILGETSRMDAALAACDAVVASAPRPDPGEEACGGRFAADALRMGRPLLAHPLAPGAELIQAGSPAGCVVQDQSPVGWASVIQQAMDEDWLSGVSRAANETSERVGMESVVERIEQALAITGSVRALQR